MELPRDNETAPAGFETFERILPSQMRQGSKIKITTESGNVHIFEALDGKNVRVISSPSKSLQNVEGKILGGFEKERDATIMGFRDGMRGIFHSSIISKLEGMDVLPDTNTTATTAILGKYFPHPSDSILKRAVIEHEAKVLGIFHRPKEAHVDFVDFGTLHAKVTASILDLFSRVDHGNIGFDAQTFEEIGRTFSTFIEDHEMDIGQEPISTIKKEVVINTPQGPKRYIATAILGTSTNLAIVFTVSKIPDAQSAN